MKLNISKLVDNMTIAMFVPVAIAGSIAVMILSYLLVPLFIVGIVFFTIKTLKEVDIDE